jgi:hypothetical protein
MMKNDHSAFVAHESFGKWKSRGSLRLSITGIALEQIVQNS